MHSNLKTFNTIKLYKSWTIFGDFYWFFHFLNSNSNLKNRSGCYRAVPLPRRGGNNGYRGNHSGYQRYKKPWLLYVVKNRRLVNILCSQRQGRHCSSSLSGLKTKRGPITDKWGLEISDFRPITQREPEISLPKFRHRAAQLTTSLWSIHIQRMKSHLNR
jgi:hypothetical protein